MANIKIKINGVNQVIGNLNKINSSLDDMSEPLEESGAYFLMRAYDNFESQGSDFGEPWQRLSPATVNWKRRNFPGTENRPLYRTGKMVNSFKYDLLGRGSVVITNDAPYFIKHQSPNAADRRIIPFGNQASSATTIPRRVLLKVDKAGLNRVVSIFNHWVRKKIQQSF